MNRSRSHCGAPGRIGSAGVPLSAGGGENMLLRKKKGQSTMEYIVLFAAVVAAILAFAYTSLRGGVKRVLDESGNKIDSAADRFSRNIP